MEFDLKKVKELMAAMDKAGASRVRLKVGEEEIEIDRSAPDAPVVHHHAPPPVAAAAPIPAAAPAPVVESGTFITAPMVGTFYGAPSPEADSFVKVGDTVSEDTVVCIVEAMKVMNEVKAGVKGVIKEVLLETSHPVEFGAKLFRVG